MLHIGQQVVCINDEAQEFWAVRGYPELGIKRGRIYTIRDITSDTYYIAAGEIMVWLYEAECTLPPYPDSTRRGFSGWRFRPVKRVETDISVFQAALTGAKEDA